MNIHCRRVLGLILIAVVAIALGGCSEWVNTLKARQAFQTANGAYGTKEYQTAIDEYMEVLELDPEGDRRVVVPTYFYIGSSHHLIYTVSRLNEAEREQRINDAIKYYEIALEKAAEGGPFQEQLGVYRQYASEQLAAIYRDYRDDFEQAEKYCAMLIEMDPDNPERYYAIANIYERFHDPDELPLVDKAIEAYEKPVEMNPDDPLSYRQMAGLLNKHGRFEETMEWLSRARDLQVDNPEGYYLLATHYWDKVYRDPDLSMEEREGFIGMGLEQLEQAREIQSDYVDALVYTGLLIREQAKIAEIKGDKRKHDELITEANRFRDQALELRKLQETETPSG